jgi:hypothetical protein
MIIAFLATMLVACGDKAEDTAAPEEVEEQTGDTAHEELEEETEDSASEVEGEE